MKKSIITFYVFLLGLNISAQDSLYVNKNGQAQDSLFVNKHGNIMLPQKGDIGIGFSADPFLYYFGNMFNGTSDNNLNLSDQKFYFRYVIDSRSAFRLTIAINTSNNVANFYVIDDAARLTNPLSNQQVEDRETTASHFYHGRVGYERFRGYKRLRGFYGADLGYSYQTGNVKREYGNQMSSLNPSPTTNWGNLSDRFLENNNGSVMTISLGAFTGIEYYFAPKICIGTELGLLYGYSWGSESYTRGEKMVVSQYVIYDKALSPGNSSYNIKTSFPYTYGSIYLMFHF
jgi:hypothetical protein